MSTPAEKTIRIDIKEAVHDDSFRLVTYGEEFWKQTGYFQAGIAYDVATVVSMVTRRVSPGRSAPVRMAVARLSLINSASLPSPSL